MISPVTGEGEKENFAYHTGLICYLDTYYYQAFIWNWARDQASMLHPISFNLDKEKEVAQVDNQANRFPTVDDCN